MEQYQYQVQEKSLTMGFLTNYVWNPVQQRLPVSLKPNTITIFGFISILLSGILVWMTFYGHYWAFLVAAVCTFVYMACDNIDGIHARRTKQSSRLGEFLDHWFDSISSIVVNLSCAMAFGMEGWLLSTYLVVLAIAFFATIWEHHHTGIFYSGHIGTNEALMLVMVFYTLLYFFQGASWLVYTPGQWSFIAVLALISIIGSGFTLIACMIRVKKHLWQVVVLAIALVSISAWQWQGHLPDVVTAILILACNSLLSGGLIVSHLLHKNVYTRYTMTAILAVVAVVLLFVAIPGYVYNYFWYSITGLLGAVIAWDGLHTIYQLRKVKGKQ